MARHLLVTNDYLPKTGGIQVYLHELWQRLEPGRAAVLTASSHADAAAFDATSDVVIERVPAKTLFAPTWSAYRQIEAAIERHQPDLVLLDPVWPLGLLGRSLSRPYGVVLHGAEVTIPGRIPVVASTLRSVLRHAKVVVCAGTYPESVARHSLGEYLPPVVQVPPGVDTERFVPLDAEQRSAVRLELGRSEDEFIIAAYSRLVPRKGIDILIEAAALLSPLHPQLRVLIGGNGRDRERLEKLASAKNAPVTFLGRVDDDLLPGFLGASDLMVMNCRSRWLGLEQEGFGIVFVEAAAAGVAQIAGRSGGSHEAVRHEVTGLILEKTRSPRELADAISGLMDNPDRLAVLSHQARVVAERTWDWRTLATTLSEGLAPFDHFEEPFRA
jgi:phosphatidylinositol alpha-1,6-mannosyltransferase